jgi:hypothetical protein
MNNPRISAITRLHVSFDFAAWRSFCRSQLSEGVVQYLQVACWFWLGRKTHLGCDRTDNIAHYLCAEHAVAITDKVLKVSVFT